MIQGGRSGGHWPGPPANAGPNTKGSQFFITTSSPGFLNELHTIFGEVIQGYEVAVAITQVPRDPRDRPLTPVTLTAVELSDKPPATVRAAPTPKP